MATDDDKVEVEKIKARARIWGYVCNMFCTLFVCLLLGAGCVATEWRLAKQAEYEAQKKG